MRSQLKKLNEEVYELTEAIIDYDKAKDKDLQQMHYHLTEEFADVMVLLMQIKLFYGIKDDDINDVMDSKIERQLKRIEKEQDNG